MFLEESVNRYLLLHLLTWAGHLSIVLHHVLELWMQIVEDLVEQLVVMR